MNYGRPRKRFGQHFLHDPTTLARLVACMSPAPTDHFVEIGPGRGALTRPLLEKVARLDVIEVDRDLAARLQKDLSDPRLQVHIGDALRFDFATLGDELRLAGNLPYNISTPLLFHLLGFGPLFRDLHVMLQKEVVDRMVAPPGGRTYGRLTVALAARCRVERLLVIRAGAFTPPPTVDSAFVRLIPEPGRHGTIDSAKAFDRVVTQAFSMRRKRLANALKGLISEAELGELRVDPDCRPQTLDAAAYIRIANHYAARHADDDNAVE